MFFNNHINFKCNENYKEILEKINFLKFNIKFKLSSKFSSFNDNSLIPIFLFLK